MDAHELKESRVGYPTVEAPAIPPEWLAEFEAAARRPLETRFRYAFIHTHKPVMDEPRLAPARNPVDECINIGQALTTALENLHSHGLVHRDIKPAYVALFEASTSILVGGSWEQRLRCRRNAHGS